MRQNINEADVVEYIRALPKGLLPYELFLAIAGKTTLSIMEIVPLRQRNGKVEV